MTAAVSVTKTFEVEEAVVLHGLWVDAALHIWGEPLGDHPRRVRRHSGAHVRARRHPAVLDASDLHTYVTRNSSVSGIGSQIVLDLPTDGGQPMASPAPWHEGSVEARANRLLKPWKVPTLRLEVDSAVAWLGSLSVFSSAHPEIRVGSSLQYLAVVAGFARELAGRGRFLPGVDLVRQDGFEARWKPVVFGADVPRLQTLISAMPPVCRVARAISIRESVVSGDPQVIVRNMIEVIVDATVRSDVKQPTPGRRGPRRKSVLDTSGDRFLRALCGPDAAIEALSDAGEVEKMAVVLAEWRAATADISAAIRTCFRLVPPRDAMSEVARVAAEAHDDEQVDEQIVDIEATQDFWRVEFLLQSIDDPSLLVSAHDIWEAGETLDVLGVEVVYPQEQLISDLGSAARLVPDLTRALAEARPSELEFDGQGAANFLATSAKVLEQAGFGVLLPSWWGTRQSKLGVKLHAETEKFDQGPSVIGGSGLCDYRLDVAIGDAVISEYELEELARLKMPLVRVCGQWVEINERDLEAALAVARRKGKRHGQMSAAEVIKVGLGLQDADVGLPVVGLSATGWLGELLDGPGLRVGKLPPIDNFNAQLRPYQERGVSWLWFFHRLGMGACLADDMGLGKTAQLLALLAAERTPSRTASGRKRRIARPDPTLVICPMSLVGNWQREAERFAPGLEIYVHHGSERIKTDGFVAKVASADLVLTTYALSVRDQKLLSSATWGRVVLDEAQNIKNSDARQSKAVRSIPAGRRLALTGTPVENRLSELWSIMDFLNPSLLGTEDGFKDRFAIPIEQNGDADAADTLRRLTAPFILRRLKTDKTVIADLPEKLEMKTFCNLTREQASLYKATVNDMMEKIERATGMERRGLVLAAMTKLKQICNHPAQFLRDGSRVSGRSGKLSVLEETISEILAEGERVLIFTQYTEMGAMLRAHLEAKFRTNAQWLYGGTSKKTRDKMVERFQSEEPGAPPIFLISLKAGGTGLNLTAASHVIHFDRWWNPAVEDQATDRAFRIGQKNNVQVRKFVCMGTLEEKIDQMIESKRSLADRVVGTGDGWVTELSTSAIRDLVALSADAVGE